jgi:hypothetical protein
LCFSAKQEESWFATPLYLNGGEPVKYGGRADRYSYGGRR